MTEPESPETPPVSRPDPTAKDAGVDLTFEMALKKLEEVVDRLEQGELELEASLAAFEEGVRLSQHCARQLKAAESRIEVLIREGEDWIVRPFEAAGDERDADEDAEATPSSDRSEPEEEA